MFGDRDWDGDKEVECKYCGEMGLHWEQIGGKWFLFDEDEDRHDCPERQQAQRSRAQDDFA